MLYIAGYILNSALFFADVLTGRNLTFTHGGTTCHLEVTMESTGKQRKHRFLKAELAVLVCLACFWAFKSGAIDIDAVKAGVLRQVVKIDPDNIDAHHFLADYYDYSDRYEEAIGAYKETVRIDPNDLHAQLNLASVYHDLGRFEEAAQAYREAIRIDPNDAGIWNHLAGACASGGRHEEAIDVYKQIDSIDPDRAWIQVSLASVYQDWGRFEEAAQAYREAIRIYKNSAGTQLYLAFTYQGFCRNEDSIKPRTRTRIIEMEPDIVVLNVLLGRACVKAGHPEEAIVAYKHAISTHIDYAEAHRELGEIYLRTGNTDFALEEYEILKTLDEELADELLALLQE